MLVLVTVIEDANLSPFMSGLFLLQPLLFRLEVNDVHPEREHHPAKTRHQNQLSGVNQPGLNVSLRIVGQRRPTPRTTPR
jgi:hypothetical protein